MPSAAATIVGFGTRTPELVLHLVALAVKQGLVSTVTPVRSSALELALLSPPHRIFLKSNPKEGEKATTLVQELIVYCLPSISDHALNSIGEVNMIRSKILSASCCVAVYDPTSNRFLSSGIETIMGGLNGDNAAVAALNSLALGALSSLDSKASIQLHPATGRHDTVIVVGSGGREHAIAVALARSPFLASVICCPGNGGTAVEGGKISNAPSGYTQGNEDVTKLVKEVGAQMVVVGPEAPLVDGLVDTLIVKCPGVRAFGPTKAAAELEASKVWCITNIFCADKT